MKFNKLILLLFTLGFFSVSAQKNFAKDADFAYMNEQFYSAIDLYKKAEVKEKKVQEKGRINYMIAECYNNILDPKQAETYYKRAIQLKYEKINPDVVLQLAHIMKQQGNYKDAKKEYENYLVLKPGDKEGQLGAESCRLAIQWIAEPTKHIITKEYQLNTEGYDWAPVFADKKHSELVFSSSRQGSAGSDIDPRTGVGFMDLWTTTRDNNGKWSEPKRLPEVINTPDNEGAATFDNKMTTIYFTRCPREKKQNIGCDIVFSEKQGNNWKPTQSLGMKPSGADSLSCGHPTISNDGKYIIFAADFPGGFGGKDLWITEYDRREKKWTIPVNLGSSVNTPGDDMFPYLREDGVLFYSTDGLPGLGGLDIFMADKTGEKSWGNPKNLEYPMNSAEHDFGIIFDRGKPEKGFFTSSRPGGKGLDDIYSFRLPELIFSLECIVKDKETLLPISNATVTLSGSDGSIVTKQTDENGVAIFEEDAGKRYVLAETNYEVKAAEPCYIAGTTKFSTTGLTESKKFIQEFFLQNTCGKVVDMPEVQYPYNKWNLLVIPGEVNSEDSLMFLYNVLVENPTWKIELQAHTDCRGSRPYNLKLSQNRAKTCVDFLIGKGIHPGRLVAKGYAQDVPRAAGLECETIKKMKTKEEQEAAHQRNRRTQFLVLDREWKEPGK
ncbi:MAG: OmpA family protein [Flavobacteriales bacterium]